MLDATEVPWDREGGASIRRKALGVEQRGRKGTVAIGAW